MLQRNVEDKSLVMKLSVWFLFGSDYQIFGWIKKYRPRLLAMCNYLEISKNSLGSKLISLKENGDK